MTRPRCKFKIKFSPRIREFEPKGVEKCNLRFIEISPEEAEALRLKDVGGLDQTAAAKAMGVSQSTFQRILASAHKKTSFALIRGKAIKIMDKEIDKNIKNKNQK